MIPILKVTSIHLITPRNCFNALINMFNMSPMVNITYPITDLIRFQLSDISITCYHVDSGEYNIPIWWDPYVPYHYNMLPMMNIYYPYVLVWS